MYAQPPRFDSTTSLQRFLIQIGLRGVQLVRTSLLKPWRQRTGNAEIRVLSICWLLPRTSGHSRSRSSKEYVCHRAGRKSSGLELGLTWRQYSSWVAMSGSSKCWAIGMMARAGWTFWLWREVGPSNTSTTLGCTLSKSVLDTRRNTGRQSFVRIFKSSWRSKMKIEPYWSIEMEVELNVERIGEWCLNWRNCDWHTPST